jgi:hypothetical protein
MGLRPAPPDGDAEIVGGRSGMAKFVNDAKHLADGSVKATGRSASNP